MPGRGTRSPRINATFVDVVVMSIATGWQLSDNKFRNSSDALLRPSQYY